MKECWYEEALFKRASTYGPWLRVEIKGKKKLGRSILFDRITSGSAPNIGDSSKVNGEVKGDDPKSDDPQGTSPIIIPGSKEDQESTREIETAFNASDTSIRAGKGKDADIPILVTPQEGERTLPSGNSTQDKNVIEEGKGADSVNSEMAPALDNIICNSLKKIRVTNKRKREENECEADFEFFSCAKRKALHDGNGVPLFDEEGPSLDQNHQLLEGRFNPCPLLFAPVWGLS
ncbi:hypothetical protein V6N11_037535 [Hibiscus sabdariffa]|uniref:Uncharacterized protein n=1 Tax=Hibiscus sabdariffa TaxID=183260 RepID=A0ABR2P1N8_9ROSI